MRILVIGGGLIGLTTAYFLNRRGHDVTVIDRAEGVGRETSFANGALLTPSMAEPWNTPGCWRILLASLTRSDAALQLRLRALPGLAGWGVTFLRNSQNQLFQRNRLSNLRLALHSLEVMHGLRREVPVEYGRRTNGSLKVFRDSASLERASVAAHGLLSEGLKSRTLTASQTIALEPALAEPVTCGRRAQCRRLRTVGSRGEARRAPCLGTRGIAIGASARDRLHVGCGYARDDGSSRRGGQSILFTQA